MGWALTHLEDVGLAVWEHGVLVVLSVAIALSISLVAGVAVSRHSQLYRLVMGITSVLYTVPSLALFALLIPLVGLGRVTAVIGLVVYSLMILIRNVATGIREVPPDVVEAAIGMGLSRRQLLFRIELPLAMPVIIAGVRIATVTVIAVATVAAYINAGGLGTLIFGGINQNFPAKIAIGGLLTSLLAVAADAGLSGLERRLRSIRTESPPA